MGLNSSPSCCTALPLHQFFLYHSVSPPPCFSTSLGFFTSLCFSISVHRSSLFLLLPHTLFLSSSDFLPSRSLYLPSVLQFSSSSLPVTFCLSSRLSLPPVFPFYFSIYIAYWFDFSLSPSLSIFSHDHPNYFKFSVIPTSAISQDRHLVTDYSILPYCDVPGSIR